MTSIGSFCLYLTTIMHLQTGVYGFTDKEVKLSKRNGKFFGVGVVRFQNTVCQAANGLIGTCYTRWQCGSIGGYGSGKCAQIASCCVVQATCGGTVSNNNTYFHNPEYPNSSAGGYTCSVTIQRCSSEICQLRLDFLSLTLAQPNGNGTCATDSLTVSGGATQVRRICGENSGQHMYVDFKGGNTISLTIETSSAVSLARQWNIQIEQIECDNPGRAPTGCLMYYNSPSGTVTSFNYAPAVSSQLLTFPDGTTGPGTRQLSNMNYGICVGLQPGSCSITWSQTSGDPYSFTVSGNTAGTATAPGLPADGMNGTACRRNFVVVPNPIAGQATGTDRFCGNQLPDLTTSSKPFVLTVVTTGSAIDTVNPNINNQDVGNRGFSLSFAQNPCSMTVNSNR